MYNKEYFIKNISDTYFAEETGGLLVKYNEMA